MPPTLKAVAKGVRRSIFGTDGLRAAGNGGVRKRMCNDREESSLSRGGRPNLATTLDDLASVELERVLTGT